MTIQQALSIVLDYVERWNKQDQDTETAEAASILDQYIHKQLAYKAAQVQAAKLTNQQYTPEQRSAAAKKAWEKKRARHSLP